MRQRVVFLLAAGAISLVAAGAALAGTTTVTPAHMHGWSAVNDTCGAPSTGAIGFVTGPSTPPAGSGSVQLTVGSNGDSYPTLRTAHFDGVKLSSLTALDYWTYVSHAGSGSQAPYIDLYVDWNGDGVRDDIVTFEPVYQTSQSVALNTWQHWDALHGLWWSDNLGGPPPLFTLSSYLSTHPDATILGGSEQSFILAAGCGGSAWTNFVGNADELTVGVNGNNSTYDFEPTIGPPTSKSQCMHGGWKTFNNPSFKNQGQCVSYVEHHTNRGSTKSKKHHHHNHHS